MKIPIQSYSDIITNSSSELFVIASDKSTSELEYIFEDIYREDRRYIDELYEKYKDYSAVSERLEGGIYDRPTGDGGDCDIRIIDKEEAMDYIGKSDRPKYRNKNIARIFIDKGRKHTINYIKNNFNIISHCNL